MAGGARDRPSSLRLEQQQQQQQQQQHAPDPWKEDAGVSVEPLTPNSPVRTHTPVGLAGAPATVVVAHKPSNLGHTVSSMIRTLSTQAMEAAREVAARGSDLRPARRPSELALENKAKRQSRTTKHAVASEHVRDVVTHVLGQKKDQDRAVCVPEL